MNIKKEEIFEYFQDKGLVNARKFKKDIYSETNKIDNQITNKSSLEYINKILVAHDTVFFNHLKQLSNNSYTDSGKFVNGVDRYIDSILGADKLRQSELKSYIYDKLEAFVSNFTSVKHDMIIDFTDFSSDISEDETAVISSQELMYDQHRKLKYIFEVVEKCEYIDIHISDASLFETYYWSVFLFNRSQKSVFYFDHDVGDLIHTEKLKVLSTTYDYLNKEVQERVMVLRGIVDEKIKYNKRIEVMKSSLQRVKYALENIGKEVSGLEILANNLDQYTLDDLLYFVQQYNINYINIDENSYEIFERLFITIIEMRNDNRIKDSRKKWEQIEDRVLKSEKMFENHEFSGMKIRTPSYIKKYSNIAKNQILSYVVKVFCRYYQFDEKDLKEFLKVFFSKAESQKDTNIMKKNYNDLYMCYPDNSRYSDNYYLQLDFIYPYHFLRESDM